MGITADIDTSQMDEAIRDTMRVLGRSAPGAVMAASVRFAQSGRAATPIMRKNKKRTIQPMPDVGPQPRGTGSRRSGKWRIIVRHQNKPNTYFLTDDKKDKRRRIRNRGAAKNSWMGMLRGLGRRGSAFSNGVGVKLGSARKRLNPVDPSVTLINSLSFLFKAAPNIDQTAINAAARGMQKYIDDQLVNRMKRQWR